MKRLSNATELLDGPLDATLLAGNLRDLRRVNRWLGGSRLSLDALLPFGRGASGRARMRMLDVGTGAADIPRFLARATSRRKPRLELRATDVRPEIVTQAQANVRGTDIDVELADIQAAIEFLGHMRRVATTAVVVNDLNRGWRWLIGAWLVTRMFTRNEYTRHDAPLSVRRAYTADELVDLAHEAGLRPVAHYRAWPGHRYAIVFLPETATSG